MPRADWHGTPIPKRCRWCAGRGVDFDVPARLAQVTREFLHARAPARQAHIRTHIRNRPMAQLRALPACTPEFPYKSWLARYVQIAEEHYILPFPVEAVSELACRRCAGTGEEPANSESPVIRP